MGGFEEAKGRVKQAAGDLTENEELEREGEAQDEAAEARAEARGREAEASDQEAKQRAAQDAK